MKFFFKRKRDKNVKDGIKLKGIFSNRLNKSSSKKLIIGNTDNKQKAEYGKETSNNEYNSKEEVEDKPSSIQEIELKEETHNEVLVKEAQQSDIGSEERCDLCKAELGDDWKKPTWKWNIDKDIRLCPKCYSVKEKEYEKLLNYCALCSLKLKFFRYNPKPQWKIKGQLCRKCWDTKNEQYKNIIEKN